MSVMHTNLSRLKLERVNVPPFLSSAIWEQLLLHADFILFTWRFLWWHDEVKVRDFFPFLTKLLGPPHMPTK